MGLAEVKERKSLRRVPVKPPAHSGRALVRVFLGTRGAPARGAPGARSTPAGRVARALGEHRVRRAPGEARRLLEGGACRLPGDGARRLPGTRFVGAGAWCADCGGRGLPPAAGGVVRRLRGTRSAARRVPVGPAPSRASVRSDARRTRGTARRSSTRGSASACTYAGDAVRFLRAGSSVGGSAGRPDPRSGSPARPPAPEPGIPRRGPRPAYPWHPGRVVHRVGPSPGGDPGVGRYRRVR